MPTVDYKPFANGGGANVVSQAAYDALLAGALANGYVAGTATSAQLNKTWRQSSMMTAAVANFISNLLSINVLDDGDVAALTANLTAAIGAEAIAAVTGGSTLVGQGLVLFQYSSATSCLLVPHNGNSMVIDNTNVAIPAAGIPLASSLLAASTVYNVYCYKFAGTVSGAANNGGGLVRLTVNSTTNLATGYTLTVSGVGGTVEANGTWTITVVDATHIDLQASAFVHAYTAGGVLSGPVLLASATGHTRATNGTEVMTGDSTKALVGKVFTNGSTQFQDDNSWRGVRSWFNDIGINISTLNTGGGATVIATGVLVSFGSETISAIGTFAPVTGGPASITSPGLNDNGVDMTNGASTYAAVGLAAAAAYYATLPGSVRLTEGNHTIISFYSPSGGGTNMAALYASVSGRDN